MIKELSASTVHTIQDSAVLITSNAQEITTTLYNIAFKRYPDLENLFIDAPDNQSSLLAEAISAYAVNIDNLIVLSPALQTIAHTHVQKNIRSSHYTMTGFAFIESLELVLKEKASLILIDAWREAYIYLSQTLIQIEQEIYQKKTLKGTL